MRIFEYAMLVKTVQEANMNIVRIVFLLTVVGMGQVALAHCEVPCGIYGDETRFSMLSEHLDTIEKAMTQAVAIADQDHPNTNQIIRWTLTKETHADAFREILIQYFLTQRIKPVTDAGDIRNTYLAQIERIHQLVVLSMKCKQGTDTGHVLKAREVLAAFKKAYTQSH